MKIYCVKNVIYWLDRFKRKNRYEVIFKGVNNKLNYKFKIQDNVTLDISSDDETIDTCSTIKDLYRIDLGDTEFTPISFKEITYKSDTEVFEENFTSIYFPAQLYVKLFKIMNERVNFTFRVDDRYFDAYHIDGKVLYTSEDNTEFRVIGTTLFQLAKTYPNYEILNICYPSKRLSYGEFLDKQDGIAKKKYKKFVRLIEKRERRRI